MAGVPERSTINFGCVRVRTPAACVVGKGLIHGAMPLGQNIESSGVNKEEKQTLE